MTDEDYSKPLVDIVIPTYNKASTVGRAIASVKAQTLSNLRCFVVNNNSTDDSKAVILEAIRDDSRFHYLDCYDQGVAYARNKGVFAGEAPFICCLDSDDAIDPRFLEVCVNELEKDPSIGIAYTGLWAVEPDGKQGLSPWPGVFDYDRSLSGANQIPTCNVSRREVWERTGGQRSRYCPYGAGEEDAEMWLRAGSLGFAGKKVVNEGLFIYSWKSGAVSGNKQHRMTDYRAWHPWVQDGEHPFASVATPKRMSHKVRQYDDPVVSVVIPVASRHINTITDALDSLEAQTFRQWEAILVNDTTIPDDWLKPIQTNFPFLKVVNTHGKGAGAARNAGAKIARAPFLLFLDADDFLAVDAIKDMLTMWKAEQSIVYSDYISKIRTDEASLRNLYGEALIQYVNGEGAVLSTSLEYDCTEAINQPRPYKGGYPYVWCLITALVPKLWHDEIGGFDESMISWEDWDYWIRLAKAGKCFTRVPKPLVTYRFYSGERREAGLQSAANLVQYLKSKYEGINNMPCGCRQPSGVSRAQSTPRQVNQGVTQTMTVSDSDLILCIYTSIQRGDHRVVGGATGRNYGYRTPGDKFLVHKADIAAQPNLFRPFQNGADTVPVAKNEAVTPPPSFVENHTPAITAPIAEALEDDLQTVPGISAIHAQLLNAAGVHTFQDLVDFGPDNLKKFKGIADTKADTIIEFARKKIAGEL